MRKEWNIETVNITPPAPKPQVEKESTEKGGKALRFLKKHWMKTLLILLCLYLSFLLFAMLISGYYIDENGIRQPIVLSMDYLADREDYRELREHYDAIEDLVVDMTVIDIHLANEDITAMEAATLYTALLNERVDIMIPKITAMELGDEQAVLQQSMESILSNDIAVYLQKMIAGLKTGNTDSINTAMVWRDKLLASFHVIRSDMANLCDRVKSDSTDLREWNLSEEALKRDATAYLKESQ